MEAEEANETMEAAARRWIQKPKVRHGGDDDGDDDDDGDEPTELASM